MFSLLVKTKTQKTLLLYLAKRSGLRSRSGNIHRPTGQGFDSHVQAIFVGLLSWRGGEGVGEGIK